MTSSNIEVLLEKWEKDTAFRAQLRSDPEAAVRAAGLSLTEDERAALRSVDWSQSDEQLAARASKMGS